MDFSELGNPPDPQKITSQRFELSPHFKWAGDEGEEGKLQLSWSKERLRQFPDQNTKFGISVSLSNQYAEPLKWQAKLFRIITKYRDREPRDGSGNSLSGSLETKHTGLSVKLTSPKRMDGPRTFTSAPLSKRSMITMLVIMITSATKQPSAKNGKQSDGQAISRWDIIEQIILKDSWKTKKSSPKITGLWNLVFFGSSINTGRPMLNGCMNQTVPMIQTLLMRVISRVLGNGMGKMRQPKSNHPWFPFIWFALLLIGIISLLLTNSRNQLHQQIIDSEARFLRKNFSQNFEEFFLEALAKDSLEEESIEQLDTWFDTRSMITQTAVRSLEFPQVLGVQSYDQDFKHKTYPPRLSPPDYPTEDFFDTQKRGWVLRQLSQHPRPQAAELN